MNAKTMRYATSFIIGQFFLWGSVVANSFEASTPAHPAPLILTDAWSSALSFVEQDRYAWKTADSEWWAWTSDGLAVTLDEEGLEVSTAAGAAIRFGDWTLHRSTLLADPSDVAMPFPWQSQPSPLVVGGNYAYRSLGWGVEQHSNGAEGLEQSLWLDQAPSGEGPLVLQLEFQSSLQCFVLNNTVLLFRGLDEELGYRDLEVLDATGRSLPATMVCDDQAIVFEIDDRNAVYPLFVDPLITTANWYADPTDAAASFGYSVSGAGDVNGDGYHDVVVGAYLYSSTISQEGRAYLFLGSASGLSSTPSWASDPTDVTTAQYGFSVAGVGDINGDGLADVVVGAPGYTGTNSKQGRVYLYFGTDQGTGLQTSPAWYYSPANTNAQAGYSARGAGDINCDGINDFVVGLPGYSSTFVTEGRALAFHGVSGSIPASTPAWTVDSADQANASFGASVSSAGDINGDGCGDVIVGAWRWGTTYSGEGRAFIYHGSSAGLSTSSLWSVHPSDQADANFGISVSGAGDVNGDGYSDVAVGARYDNAIKGGRVYVFSGSSTGASASATWTLDQTSTASAGFGSSVAGVDDVNADGFADLMVGAPYWTDGSYSQEGRAYLYLGSSSGLPSRPSDTFDPADQATAQFGTSVARAGDLNRDGFADVIVGAPGWTGSTSGEGRAYAFVGTSLGPSTTSTDQIDPTDQNSSVFGGALANVGDIDGDGFGEVLVGASRWSSDVYVREGAAYVFSGSSTAVVPDYVWRADPTDQIDARFGNSVAGAGDVNGDGFADILVGAYQETGSHTQEGMAYAWYGSRTGLTTEPDWVVEPANKTAARFAYSVAGGGDVNGDGYGDVVVGCSLCGASNQGRVYLYLGSATGLGTNAAWTAEPPEAARNEAGTDVAIVGDINRDGAADILVGAPYHDGSGYSDEGRAYLYLGVKGGLPSTTASWTNDPVNQASAYFGIAVAGAGDVNNDGYSDVMVGASSATGDYSYEGIVYLWLGSATGLASSANWTLHPADVTSAQFGTDLAGVGDVNGDGYDDIGVLAPNWSGPNTTDPGRAYLFFGSNAGPSTTANWTIDNDNQPQLGVGRAMSGGADINGDAFSDLAIGDQYYDDLSYGEEGRIYTFFGGDDAPGLLRGLEQYRDGETEPVGAGARLASSSITLQLILSRTTPRGAPVSGQVEVKKVGVNFDGTGLLSSSTYNANRGSVVSLVITGLEQGERYHWRARVRTSLEQSYSRWFYFGSNQESDTDFWYRFVDSDSDSLDDSYDNCPYVANPDQADDDGDGIGEACDACPNDASNDPDEDEVCAASDNCPDAYNPTQYNEDYDDYGDTCDICPGDPYDDSDADGYCGDEDNCPDVANDQTDTDGDKGGDACDICPLDSNDDQDADGFCAEVDNCDATANADQSDSDGDTLGDACDSCPYDAANDSDRDGRCADVDNCPTTSNSNQQNSDNDAFGDACDSCDYDAANDSDADGRCADVDNCDTVANADQTDTDADGVGDACDLCINDPYNDVDDDSVCGESDNCPTISNSIQLDSDGDSQGDACDVCPNDASDDIDEDGICGDVDNCPTRANSDQANFDGDALGNVCDSCTRDANNDQDGDSRCGDVDNCPSVSNRDQTNNDGDSYGDACDVCIYDVDNDADGDSYCESLDNCPTTTNADQADSDSDTVGDACDLCPYASSNDGDSDGVCDEVDNCFGLANTDQTDTDGDNRGDACDACINDAFDDQDDDGFCADQDNCPMQTNASQLDSDSDGTGDSCDICPYDDLNDIDADLVCGNADNCPTISNSSQSDIDDDGIGDACSAEVCDGLDNDGNGIIDDDFSDLDADSLADCIDRCELDPDNDRDGDGICGNEDRCASTYDPSQADSDQDGLGDACDTCPDDDLNDIDQDAVCGDADNCPTLANADQADVDGNGIGDACSAEVCDGMDNDGNGVTDDTFEDSDGDQIADCVDRCLEDPKNDEDGDGICGDVDLCPEISDVGQNDTDSDQVGDACDSCPLDALNDFDADSACGEVDNCPNTSNFDQVDTDSDGAGDACDVCALDSENDRENDGYCESNDNCPELSNASQSDADNDGVGDACDSCPNDSDNDLDLDAICGDIDNCPEQANVHQDDEDSDGFGDACDLCSLDIDNDADNDDVCADVDNCPEVKNSLQSDTDEDGIGDACDLCALDPDNDPDDDGICDDEDNCPGTSNGDQADSNGDGRGDACDEANTTPIGDDDSPAGDDDSPPDVEPTPEATPTDDSASCACHSGTPSNQGGWTLLLLVLPLLVRFRRRS